MLHFLALLNVVDLLFVSLPEPIRFVRNTEIVYHCLIFRRYDELCCGAFDSDFLKVVPAS